MTQLGTGVSKDPLETFTLGPSPFLPDPNVLYLHLTGSVALSGDAPTMNAEDMSASLGTLVLSGAGSVQPGITFANIGDLPGNPTALGRSDGSSIQTSQAQVVRVFQPADDFDEDGSQDGFDNCPFIGNADQADFGGVRSPTNPLGTNLDGIGNACQCGDLFPLISANGIVDTDDLDSLRQELLNPSATSSPPPLCSVTGGVECDIRDLVVLKLAGEGRALCSNNAEPMTANWENT